MSACRGRLLITPRSIRCKSTFAQPHDSNFGAYKPKLDLNPVILSLTCGWLTTEAVNVLRARFGPSEKDKKPLVRGLLATLVDNMPGRPEARFVYKKTIKKMCSSQEPIPLTARLRLNSKRDGLYFQILTGPALLAFGNTIHKFVEQEKDARLHQEFSQATLKTQFAFPFMSDLDLEIARRIWADISALYPDGIKLGHAHGLQLSRTGEGRSLMPFFSRKFWQEPKEEKLEPKEEEPPVMPMVRRVLVDPKP